VGAQNVDFSTDWQINLTRDLVSSVMQANFTPACYKSDKVKVAKIFWSARQLTKPSSGWFTIVVVVFLKGSHKIPDQVVK